MNLSSTIGKKGKTLGLAAGLLVSGVLVAGDSVDAALTAYLDKEITIDTAASGRMPDGGKLTLVYDADKKAVRVCTQSAPDQDGAWSEDLASGCKVTLSFTRGERYCSLEDVKAGDGEVLASCHRLRGSDVATRSGAKGAVELGDMIVFLLAPEQGKNAIAILIDSPSRVTDEPVIVGKF
jgi:hypothetical protein